MLRGAGLNNGGSNGNSGGGGGGGSSSYSGDASPSLRMSPPAGRSVVVRGGHGAARGPSTGLLVLLAVGVSVAYVLLAARQMTTEGRAALDADGAGADGAAGTTLPPDAAAALRPNVRVPAKGRGIGLGGDEGAGTGASAGAGAGTGAGAGKGKGAGTGVAAPSAAAPARPAVPAVPARPAAPAPSASASKTPSVTPQPQSLYGLTFDANIVDNVFIFTVVRVPSMRYAQMLQVRLRRAFPPP
jgi:hypothetical protein